MQPLNSIYIDRIYDVRFTASSMYPSLLKIHRKYIIDKLVSKKTGKSQS